MKHRGLGSTFGLKTPIARSGEVSEGRGFPGCTFYPFPKPSLGTGYRIGLCWLSPAAPPPSSENRGASGSTVRVCARHGRGGLGDDRSLLCSSQAHLAARFSV